MIGAPFHQRDGWYFTRLEDGSVRIEQRAPVVQDVWVHAEPEGHEIQRLGVVGARTLGEGERTNCGGPYVVLVSHTIPAQEWLSILCAVSAGIGGGQSLAWAERLHDGRCESISLPEAAV